MKSELIELFFTSEMSKKYHEICPYEKCDKCEQGLVMETSTICKCSLKTILTLIADIPSRYDVNVKVSKPLEKQLDKYKNFMVLLGEQKYIKLAAFYVAKKFIDDEKIVRYVMTSNVFRKESQMVEDIISLNKADLIIFEDIFEKQSSKEYLYEIKKRIDKNKSTIILGKTDMIIVDDDFLEIEVDDSDITIQE